MNYLNPDLFSKFLLKLQNRMTRLKNLLFFTMLVLMLFPFPESAISEDRTKISFGGSSIWFGDESAFAPVIDFAYDSSIEDELEFGIDLHLVGTPGDVGDLEGGGIQIRLMPYGIIKKWVSSDLNIYYKIGPQLHSWGVGDEDVGANGTWFGVRGGIELEKELSYDNTLVAELNVGYLTGETHFGNAVVNWDEDDSGMDIEIKLGYGISEGEMLSFYYNTINSGELDDNFGSVGLVFTFIR